MKIITAPDSFKGNMRADEVCAAIKEGILRSDPEAVVVSIPLADGGEGTARIITLAAGGKFVKTNVTGPLGDPVEAEFGLINNGYTAVLDMASASGMELIGKDRLNPLKTTSRGTGELISAALDTGAKELIIGIGGSATNDGGLGMISALGFRFFDKEGQPVIINSIPVPRSPFPINNTSEALTRISTIDISGADKRLKTVSLKVACDVTNPLLGPNGASAVFGPQKGATAEMVKILDAGLAKLANAWVKAGLAADVEQPGDGAAGGVGAALRICLGAKMESGAKLVMSYSGFYDHLPEADLVITGEGITDSQTNAGKLCSIVALESRKAGIPVALLSGAISGEINRLFSSFDYAASISCGQIGLEAMIKDSRRDLIFAVENLIRAIKLGKKTGKKNII